MHKLFLFLVVCTLSLLFFTSGAEAKHKASSGKGPGLSASLAKNKLSVSASFSNLTNVKTITYQLTYDSNKGQQGAAGTIKTGKLKSTSRKLLLGTCSGRVCSYHRDVSNIRLSVDFNLKSGGVVSYEKKL